MHVCPLWSLSLIGLLALLVLLLFSLITAGWLFIYVATFKNTIVYICMPLKLTYEFFNCWKFSMLVIVFVINLCVRVQNEKAANIHNYMIQSNKDLIIYINITVCNILSMITSFSFNKVHPFCSRRFIFWWSKLVLLPSHCSDLPLSPR
jgi:hypothetical protein